MSDLPPRHCTDPAIHGPHEWADDTDLRTCPGTSLRDRIAATLDSAVTARVGAVASDIHTDALTDAVMAVVEPEIAHWRTEAADGAAMAKRRGELVRELKDTLARVRELHKPCTYPGGPDQYCDHCEQVGQPVPCPCPTVRTIDGSTDE